MRRCEEALVARPAWHWAGNTPPWLALMALGLVLLSLAGSVALVWQWRVLQLERQAIEARRVALSGQGADGPASLSPLSETQAQAWSAWARSMNTPWPERFAALEGAQQAGVHLLSLRSQSKLDEWELQVRAQELQAVLRWIERLRQQLAPGAAVSVVRVSRVAGTDAPGGDASVVAQVRLRWASPTEALQ